MKKVAIFGKPGSGKSTFSKQLAIQTGLPWHSIDTMLYHKNGEQVAPSVFTDQHQSILNSERWILDGLGTIGSFNQRLEAADTLIYLNLPYPVSYWLVTKRLVKGLFSTPEGWPQGSSIIKGSMQSYKMLRLSPKFWNNELETRLLAYQNSKSVVILNSLSAIRQFLNEGSNSVN